MIFVKPAVIPIRISDIIVKHVKIKCEFIHEVNIVKRDNKRDDF